MKYANVDSTFLSYSEELDYLQNVIGLPFDITTAIVHNIRTGVNKLQFQKFLLSLGFKEEKLDQIVDIFARTLHPHWKESGLSWRQVFSWEIAVSPEEKEAMAWYFAISNQGLGGLVHMEDTPESIVLKNKNDFVKMAERLRWFLQGFAESDAIWDTYLREVSWWRKMLKKDKGASYYMTEWEKLLGE